MCGKREIDCQVARPTMSLFVLAGTLIFAELSRRQWVEPSNVELAWVEVSMALSLVGTASRRRVIKTCHHCLTQN